MTPRESPEQPVPPSSPPTAGGGGGDPFEALGLAPKFTLGSGEIERAYLARVGELHPDRASGDAVKASALNKARQVLKDPMARGEALVARFGGPAPAADKSLPPDFLAEILDVRERLEAALASGDAAQRSEWEEWAETRRRGHIATIARLFDDAAKGSAAALKSVRLELNVWRYTERVLEQLGGAEGQASL